MEFCIKSENRKWRLIYRNHINPTIFFKNKYVFVSNLHGTLIVSSLTFFCHLCTYSAIYADFSKSGGCLNIPRFIILCWKTHKIIKINWRFILKLKNRWLRFFVLRSDEKSAGIKNQYVFVLKIQSAPKKNALYIGARIQPVMSIDR